MPQAIVACDFCVVVTTTFRLLYVFVVMEHATRRILHTNVTTHPTAPWTRAQAKQRLVGPSGVKRTTLYDALLRAAQQPQPRGDGGL